MKKKWVIKFGKYHAWDLCLLPAIMTSAYLPIRYFRVDFMWLRYFMSIQYYGNRRHVGKPWPNALIAMQADHDYLVQNMDTIRAAQLGMQRYWSITDYD